jgi:hypothetical protein
MVLCDVEIETDLPKDWSDITSSGGRRDHNLIEIAFRNTATEPGMPDLTPFVTANLAKKITGLRYVGKDFDNLSVKEGINSFSVVIVDHSTASGEAAYQDVMEAAVDCDDLMTGNGVSLTDLKSVKTTMRWCRKHQDRILLYYFGALVGRTTLPSKAVRPFRDSIRPTGIFYFTRLQKAEGKFRPEKLYASYIYTSERCSWKCGTPQI